MSILPEPLSGNDLGQVVHTHVPLSPSSIIWLQSRSSDVLRLGRYGVALAMRHRLEWFIHLRAQGLRKGDQHSSWGMVLFLYFLNGHQVQVQTSHPVRFFCFQS